VTVDDDEVFSSVFYPFNQMVCLRDLRGIVEQAMVNEALDLASIGICATQTDGTESAVTDVMVVYSCLKSRLTSETFLNNFFLTTRKSMLIPKDGQVRIHNYAEANQLSDNRIIIYYSRSSVHGVVFEYTKTSSRIQTETTKIVSTVLNYQYFQDILNENLDYETTVHGAIYQIGNRRYSVYFTDEEPTDQFEFLNAFGVQETYYLYGATTVKTEIDRSEAICGRKTQYYDETVHVLHEVETAPLMVEEAEWLSQMLTSKWIARLTGTELKQVLISDIVSEITDDGEELIRLKFSWRYPDETEYYET